MIVGGRTASRIIMHVDFDYFYAQCEEIRRPEIKGRPVVVCVFSGRTEDSGVVSTANYVARKYGVRSAVPIKIAKSKLTDVPDALFLPVDMNHYSEKSEEVMSVLSAFADKFEYVGIDECFLEVTESVKDFDAAEKLARAMKKRLLEKTMLTCSIGIASNKMMAKIASDVQKPNGLTIIRPGSEMDFLSKLNTDKIPGIGPKTKERLEELGIRTVGELAKSDLFKLIEVFGKKTASYIHNAAKGIDEEPVESGDETKQLSRIVTLKKDASKSAEMYGELQELCRSVFEAAAGRKLAFKTVGINLILENLDNISRSKTLKVHSTNYELLHSTARFVLDDAMGSIGDKKVRRLGVRLSDFQSSAGQNTMFDFIES